MMNRTEESKKTVHAQEGHSQRYEEEKKLKLPSQWPDCDPCTAGKAASAMSNDATPAPTGLGKEGQAEPTETKETGNKTQKQEYSMFRDIPLFIEGKYQADIPLDYLRRQLAQYCDKPGLNLTPDYQRTHMWDQAQQESFIEHLLRGGRNNVIRLNSVNWRRPGKKPSRMELVDGKQRLIAALTFMDNRLRAFGTLLQEFKDPLPTTACLTFVVNDLPDRASVLQWYLEINEGNMTHTPGELRRARDLLEAETGPRAT